MSITGKRHRDDEDFTVRTDPRDALDEHLRALPRFSGYDDSPEEDFSLTFEPAPDIEAAASAAASAIDDLSIPVEVVEDSEISIALEALKSAPINEPTAAPALRAATLPPIPALPNTISIHRIKTRELDQAACKARNSTLAAERRVAIADGRTPIDERFPGQGTARKVTP